MAITQKRQKERRQKRAVKVRNKENSTAFFFFLVHIKSATTTPNFVENGSPLFFPQKSSNQGNERKLALF